MAELNAGDPGGTHPRLVIWTNLTEADTDPPYVTEATRSDVTVVNYGVFGGGNIIWQGALQNKNELEGGATPEWFQLADAFGNLISFTDRGIAVLGPNVLLLRPLPQAGTGMLLTARALMTGNRG